MIDDVPNYEAGTSGSILVVNYVSGYKVDSGIFTDRDKALQQFNINLARLLVRRKGYKYWRVPPHVMSDIRFDEPSKVFRVVARITVAQKPIDGFTEIDPKYRFDGSEDLYNEYLREQRKRQDVYAFGLAPNWGGTK